MSSNQFKIYIPRVEIHHTEAYIRTSFNNVADIENIEFMSRANQAGHKYNGAIITVREWFEPEYNTTFQALNAGKEHKYHHCRKYFWVLTKHVVRVSHTEPKDEDQEQIKQNTHIYIVRAENYHNEEYIKTAFRDIAIISQMTFVPKKNEKGQTYNGVVLLIREWINKTSGMYEALNESKEFRYNHSSKYHWLMTRHLIDGPPKLEETVVEAELPKDDKQKEEDEGYFTDDDATWGEHCRRLRYENQDLDEKHIDAIATYETYGSPRVIFKYTSNGIEHNC
jgi:hypothetical protein